MRDEELKKMAHDLAYIKNVLQSLVETPSVFQKKHKTPNKWKDFIFALVFFIVFILTPYLLICYC